MTDLNKLQTDLARAIGLPKRMLFFPFPFSSHTRQDIGRGQIAEHISREKLDFIRMRYVDSVIIPLLESVGLNVDSCVITWSD